MEQDMNKKEKNEYRDKKKQKTKHALSHAEPEEQEGVELNERRQWRGLIGLSTAFLKPQTAES